MPTSAAAAVMSQFSESCPVPVEIGKLNFTVKGVAGNVAVRFFDSSGQTHQHFFKVAAKDGEPRSFSVAAKGSPEHHWGGPNDGRFTGPVTGYALVVHRGIWERSRGGRVFRHLGSIPPIRAFMRSHGVFRRRSRCFAAPAMRRRSQSGFPSGRSGFPETPVSSITITPAASA